MARYAEMMTDRDAELLQEAGADVAYLTSQEHCSPTEAIAKVAAAAGFPIEKTKLLTYAYSNGVAAEQRGRTGGPLDKLGEFPMPDPDAILRRIYGHPPDKEEKAASIPCDFLSKGMAVFETDPTGLDHVAQRDLFGLPPVKSASDDDTDENGKPVGCGLMLSHTRISIGLGSPCRNDDEATKDDGPKSLQDFFRDKIGGLPEDLETVLLQLLGTKEAAMCAANAEADDAFSAAGHALDAFGAKLRHRHRSPEFKRAGLLSVNAYQPDIAALLGLYTDEVNGFLIKNASHGLLDVNAKHPWVAEAGHLHKQLQKVADLTVTANRKSAEYEAVCLLYKNKDMIRKSADWSSFLAGSLTPGVGGVAKDLLMGTDQSDLKSNIQNEILSDLDDRHHDLALQDIDTINMISDFKNDPILGPFGEKNIIRGFNQLIRTAPKTMRNPALAKAMLQQLLSQGRLAPTEYMPALEMNRMDPRENSFERREGGI